MEFFNSCAFLWLLLILVSLEVFIFAQDIFYCTRVWIHLVFKWCNYVILHLCLCLFTLDIKTWCFSMWLDQLSSNRGLNCILQWLFFGRLLTVCVKIEYLICFWFWRGIFFFFNLAQVKSRNYEFAFELLQLRALFSRFHGWIRP